MHSQSRKDVAALRHVAKAQPSSHMRGKLADFLAAVPQDGPASRGQQAHERAQESRLAHSVSAHQRNHLTFGHLQVHSG